LPSANRPKCAPGHVPEKKFFPLCKRGEGIRNTRPQEKADCWRFSRSKAKRNAENHGRLLAGVRQILDVVGHCVRKAPIRKNPHGADKDPKRSWCVTDDTQSRGALSRQKKMTSDKLKGKKGKEGAIANSSITSRPASSGGIPPQKKPKGSIGSEEEIKTKFVGKGGAEPKEIASLCRRDSHVPKLAGQM